MPRARRASFTSRFARAPHLHVLFLDGAYHEDGAELVCNELGHLQTREVGEVLQMAVRRMMRYLRRHGLNALRRHVGERLDPAGGRGHVEGKATLDLDHHHLPPPTYLQVGEALLHDNCTLAVALDEQLEELVLSRRARRAPGRSCAL
jgi:hypothetical protein